MEYTFDMFAWWDEGRTSIEDEVRMDLKTALTEPTGWLEFDRKAGNVLIDKEQDANNPVLQLILTAHMYEMIMELNSVVSDDRKLSLSQKDISLIQEDEKIDVSIDCRFIKNLQKLNVKVPLLL